MGFFFIAMVIQSMVEYCKAVFLDVLEWDLYDFKLYVVNQEEQVCLLHYLTYEF